MAARYHGNLFLVAVFYLSVLTCYEPVLGESSISALSDKEGHDEKDEKDDRESRDHRDEATQRRPEWVAICSKSFKMMDKNNDKTVDLGEIKPTHASTLAVKTLGLNIDPETVLIHADEDGNGKLSEEEYTNWFHDHMELVQRIEEDWIVGDTNKDGSLSMDEYKKSPMGQFAKEKAGVKAQDGEFKRMNRNNKAEVPKGDFLWYVSPDDFGSADRNRDAKLTKEEYMTAPFHFHDYDEKDPKEMEEEFSRADKNKDGSVTLAEYNDDLRAGIKEDREREEDEGRDDRDGRDENDDHDGRDDRSEDRKEDEQQERRKAGKGKLQKK